MPEFWSIPLHVYVFSLSMIALATVIVALYVKGYVKAGLKVLGLELSIEAREKPRQKTPKRKGP